MYRDDRLGMRGDLFCHINDVDSEGLQVNIHGHRPGPLLYHHVGRSRESKVWYQDLIPWTNVQRSAGWVQGRGPGSRGKGVLPPHVTAHRALDLCNFDPRGEIA